MAKGRFFKKKAKAETDAVASSLPIASAAWWEEKRAGSRKSGRKKK
jgi:hypothetical protein